MDIAAGCFTPICLDTHTQMFLYQARVQRNWVFFYFLQSDWGKKGTGSFHSPGSPSTPGVGDIAAPLIWQLRVENGEKCMLSGPLSGIHQRLRTLSPSFFSLPLPSLDIFHIVNGTRTNLALIYLVSFQTFCVILDVLIQSLKT